MSLRLVFSSALSLTAVIAVQEDLPVAESAMSLAVINLFMQLGLATSVSAVHTIFRNQLPVYLERYAPNLVTSDEVY